MGQRIWAVLEEYAGLWVTVSKDGAVIDSAETFGADAPGGGQRQPPDLRLRGGKPRARPR